MKRVRLFGIAICSWVYIGVADGAEAQQITNWNGAQAAPTGFFSKVAFVNGERVYSGYEVDPFSSMLSATLYTTNGDPGSAPTVQTNLGLNSNTSNAVSIAYDWQGGFFSTASETLPLFESRSYIYASSTRRPHSGAPSP